MTESSVWDRMYQESSITYRDSETCDLKVTIVGRDAPPHPMLPIYAQALEDLRRVPQARWDRWLRRSQRVQERLRVGACAVSISGWSLPLAPELRRSYTPNQYVRYDLLLPQVPEWEQSGLGELFQRVPEHLRGRIERM
jgi:hypothetical protein